MMTSLLPVTSRTLYGRSKGSKTRLTTILTRQQYVKYMYFMRILRVKYVLQHVFNKTRI